MEKWKVNLYTLWVSQICSLMGFGFVLPFIPFFLQDLGVSDPVQLNYFVGLSATLPAASMAVAAPIWGIVSDRYGRKMMILRAMLFAAIILVLMGMTQAVWQLLALRVLQGIFTGTITASMSFVSANTPENRMSYSLGLMTSSNFLGWSIGPAIGGILADIVGYRVCFIIGGAIMMVGFILVLFLVKEDKNTYGFFLKTEKEAKGKGGSIFTPFATAILLCLLVQRIARSIFSPFLALYVQESMGTLQGAASATGFINGIASLVTAVAAFTITRQGDKKDKLKTSLVLSFVSIPLISLAFPATNLTTFTIFYAGFYFLAGGVEPILSSAVSEHTPAHRRGALFGVMGTVSSVASMISPMMGSYISVTYSLRAILLIMPTFTFVQAMCIMYAQKKQRTEQAPAEGQTDSRKTLGEQDHE